MPAETYKFAPDQIVKIVKKATPKAGYDWVDGAMDQTLDMEGKVRQTITHYGAPVVKVLLYDGNIFWYLEDCLEFVEYPQNWAYRTVPETEYAFQPAEPDYCLKVSDRVNFGTKDYDVWADVHGLAGVCVKDVNCKSAEKRSGKIIRHELQAKRDRDADCGWLYYTPCGQYANGTDVFIFGEGWKFADLDGQPVPPRVPGAEILLHRKPAVETIPYVAWKPAAPGEIRPAGLERRKKDEGGHWKLSGVIGLPVEQSDIDKYEYRIPKESA